jgi:hypothetical protein
MKLSKIITVENIVLVLECKTDYFIGITLWVMPDIRKGIGLLKKQHNIATYLNFWFSNFKFMTSLVALANSFHASSPHVS